MKDLREWNGANTCSISSRSETGISTKQLLHCCLAAIGRSILCSLHPLTEQKHRITKTTVLSVTSDGMYVTVTVTSFKIVTLKDIKELRLYSTDNLVLNDSFVDGMRRRL